MAEDPARRAERTVFDALKAGLPSEVVVYYGWRWFKRGENKRSYEGEGDFVVLWPGKGILVIEVKGGREIERDSRGQWYSTSHGGGRNLINDPVMQVERNADAVADRIAGASANRERPVVCWALAFPAIHAVAGEFEIPNERLLLAKDLGRIGDAIKATFDHWSQVRASRWVPLSLDLTKSARQLLRPEVKLRDTRSLGEVGDDIEVKLDALLTSEQRHALATLSVNPRVRVCGSAGTGKTLIAQRFAESRAEQGARVLLLCHNRLLGGELTNWAAGRKGVHAGTFASFALQVLREARRPVAVPDGAARTEAVRQFWNVELPSTLLDVLGTPAGERLRFDTVLIDEAQDFAEDSLAVVEYLARAERGELHFFFDDNQNVYRQKLARQLKEPTWFTVPLTQNLRNARSISHLASRLIGEADIQANSVIGPRPEVIDVRGQSLMKVLGELVRRLVRVEEVSPTDIAILTCRQAPSDFGLFYGDFAQWDALGSSPLMEDDAVLCVRADLAKGLERRVVIVIDASSVLDEGIEDAFVAVTRAQTMVFVMTESVDRWKGYLS